MCSSYYQSSYELEFIELCREIGIFDKLENGNTYVMDNNKRMLTDFSIGNYEIEIKSTYVMERQGGIESVHEKRDEVLSNGKKYIFILDKDYSKFLDIFS